MSSLPIATPRVGGGRENATRRFPNPLGGANGSVALPSRQAAVEGTGFPERPGQLVPRDGARGAIARVLAYTDNPWNWSPPGSRRNATPRAWNLQRYVRQAFPNIAGMVKFSTAGDSNTQSTTNRPGWLAASAAASPIPFSRKQVVQSFVRNYDSRLQTLYAPRARIQRPQQARKVIAGPVGRNMGPGYQFNLSRLAPTTTYGDLTRVLHAQTGPGAPIASPTPGVTTQAHGNRSNRGA